MAIRKTNKGVVIDIDALIEAGKHERAVGNMPVNAGGEVVGSAGKIVKSNEQRVREYYETSETVSEDKVSLKGPLPKTSGSLDSKSSVQEDLKTAKTQKENVRTQEAQVSAKARLTPDPEPKAPQGESFDEEKPLGFKEVELPNGDIEMVPYYTQEEAPDGENKSNQ